MNKPTAPAARGCYFFKIAAKKLKFFLIFLVFY